MDHLLEVDGYDLRIGAVVTHRYGTTGRMTAPGDVPANEFYEPRLRRPGNFERAMFSSGATAGAGRAAFGDIELINEDDGLDDLRNFAFDGRALRLFAIEDGAPFASRVPVFTGSMEQAEISEGQVVLRVRSRLEELTQDLQKTRFLGTTTASGQGTAEGTPNDLKDRPKPLAFGRVREVPLAVVNAFDHLYQGAANAISSIEGIYEAGLPYTRVGTTQTTIAGLMSVSLLAGQYAAMLNPFIVRLGSKPTGIITADFTEGATEADRCAAQIVRRILLFAGKVEGVDFLAGDVARFAAEASAEQGVWCAPQDMSIRAPIDRILAGVRGYLTEDRLGRFRMGQLRLPSGVPKASLGDVELLEGSGGIEIVASGDQGRGIPAAKVTLSHTALWQSFDDSMIAGSVSTERKAFLKEATRQAVAEDAAVRVRHLLATEITRDTLLVQAAQASAEATAVLAIYSARREFVRIELPPEIGAGFDLADVVRLRLPRLGFDAGKLFLVIAITEELGSADDETARTILELWG